MFDHESPELRGSEDDQGDNFARGSDKNDNGIEASWTNRPSRGLSFSNRSAIPEVEVTPLPILPMIVLCEASCSAFRI